MVTNLPEEVKALWAKATMTRDPRHKLELLKIVYSKIPKHKGTANLVMNLKRQIQNLEDEIKEKEAKTKKKGSGGLEWTVKKTSAPLLSITGSIKSSATLFEKLSGIKVDLFRLYTSPLLGVFNTLDVPFQVVWAPLERGLGRWLIRRIINVILNSDIVVLSYDSCRVEDAKETSEILEEHGIVLTNRDINVDITFTSSGGIIVAGFSERLSHIEVQNALRKLKVHNAIVKISSETGVEDLEAVLIGKKFKKYLPVCIAGAKNKNSINGCEIRINNTSCLSSSCSDFYVKLGIKALRLLKLIRVYTKPPGGEVAKPPLLLPQDATVKKAVESIHSNLLKTFKYAKVYRCNRWRKVGLEFVLSDGDIIEIRG